MTTNFTAIESAIHQLPQEDIRKLVIPLLNHLETLPSDLGEENLTVNGEETKRFDSQYAVQSTVDVESISQMNDRCYDSNATPIWEVAAKISADVPAEAWAKLPSDLSKRFDYYQNSQMES